VKGFLIDENLPDRLRLKLPLPVTHSTDIAQSPSDEVIWEFARVHELVIITKDADFTERAMLGQPPPWVVHLRVGNLRRKQFEEFLSRNLPKILAHLPAAKLISVYADRMEAVS
jgi:predicted nuclease of predicted toxin-antitoxin system